MQFQKCEKHPRKSVTFSKVAGLNDCACDVLRDLVPFVEFKKREKHPWRCVTFSKVADQKLTITEQH